MLGGDGLYSYSSLILPRPGINHGNTDGLSRISGNAQAVNAIQHSLESIDIGQAQADDEYFG